MKEDYHGGMRISISNMVEAHIFFEANYINAAYSLAALYILILYLSKITNVKVEIHESSYISSKYCPLFLLCAPSKQLPDFETADYNI